MESCKDKPVAKPQTDRLGSLQAAQLRQFGKFIC